MASKSEGTPKKISNSAYVLGVDSTDKKVTIKQRTLHSSQNDVVDGITNSCYVKDVKSKDDADIDQKVQGPTEALLGSVWDFVKSYLNPLSWLNPVLARFGVILATIQPAIETASEQKFN